MSVFVATQRHKSYTLVDKKPFWKHFYPKDVAILAVRSTAMQGLMVLNAYVASLELENSDEEESSEDELEDMDDVMEEEHETFVAPTMKEFSLASAKSFGKSLSITTSLRSLEEVVLRFCRPRIARKLIKHCILASYCLQDISKSALRKYARTSSKGTSAAWMVKTGMRANLLSHVAIFLIEETQHVVLLLYRRFVAATRGTKYHKTLRWIEEGIDPKDRGNEDDTITGFVSVTGRNASRSVLAVITGGVGAAIGTAVRPGIGTLIGGTLGDSVAYVLV